MYLHICSRTASDMEHCITPRLPQSVAVLTQVACWNRNTSQCCGVKTDPRGMGSSGVQWIGVTTFWLWKVTPSSDRIHHRTQWSGHPWPLWWEHGREHESCMQTEGGTFQKIFFYTAKNPELCSTALSQWQWNVQKAVYLNIFHMDSAAVLTGEMYKLLQISIPFCILHINYH